MNPWEKKEKPEKQKNRWKRCKKTDPEKDKGKYDV